MTSLPRAPAQRLDPRKFRDPDRTAAGEPRAQVALRRLETLWINTGTLCNLECRHCYIESSPRNDRLVYITAAEVAAYLDEIAAEGLNTHEIGFTGGEPFMNPEIAPMLGDALGRGHEVLVLTNAMRPMMKHAKALLALKAEHGNRLTLRVSIDHYTEELHGAERGARSWSGTIQGLRWLCDNGFHVDVAGRTCWNESEDDLRAGFASLFGALGVPLDASDPRKLVLFPEMDPRADVPEITTACWGILGVDPDDMMCAGSRMVVKRKGAERPVVVPCTLLPYDHQFELGEPLVEARKDVKLHHPHCAKFCVLGGGSCSVG